MLITVISQYLTLHKRLVVPQLGAFVVKEADGVRSVLFSELLRRDDGVLRGLLREQGLSELEAAGEIDRFAFEIRHAVQRGSEYRMAGLGTMHPGPNGTIAFAYDPAATAATLSAQASERTEATAAPTSGSTPKRTGHVQPERVVEAVKTAFSEPYVSPSAKMQPDPSVRGLRYGRPPKTTDAYSYVDRPPRPRRGDWFIRIALIAAAIALAAILFGWYRDMRDKQADAEYIELSQPRTDDPAAAQQTDPTEEAL